MSEDIYYHRYQLKGKAELNARSRRKVLEGCLIRVGAGVGCIQPWVELGDEDLQVQLKALREGRPFRLGQRALHCARLDGEAREGGVSLFDGLTIPASHLTVLPGMDLTERELGAFSRLKIKGGEDLDSTKKAVRNCLSQVSPDCRLRIDFNEVLDATVVMNLAQFFGGEICDRIEFIEDPMKFEAGVWERLYRQTGLELAVDRDCERAVAEGAGVGWLIVKPAVMDPGLLIPRAGGGREMNNLVVTSYMDHAVGQMYAAYEAAVLKTKFPDRLGYCGLLTHDLFEQNVFFEAITSKGPDLMVPEGPGLGFDTQLEALPWKRM